MKKIVILLISMTLISVTALSQQSKDTAWKFAGETSINFSQVSLINWSAGGESSISGNGFFNIAAIYKKNKSVWENKLELAYGMMKQGEEDVRKTNDKLFISTSYGYKAAKNWYYNAYLSFKTQFADGFDYSNDTSVFISTFMSPAYLLGAIGMDYKPNDFFSLGLLPISGRLTIVNDDSLSAKGAFGVDSGDKTRLEFGGTVNLNFKKEIMKNVEFATALQLFSNYLDHPQNIDVNWEVFINMKINEFLAANINTNLIYDDDINITDKDGNVGPRTQFKEVFGIGLTYKF
ncbi:MAG: DUF3078 domain-containing protein [Bacteroidales bacterium]|nr:DUF3078 domain-containing protein [Bacteroidales bacterium]MCF8388166.1 DUF3078 domain-containing protein [Bacteroidales bacterium]MCF8399104.1 DUF3078 domain-containing protein [Bacteroidales bacterium]